MKFLKRLCYILLILLIGFCGLIFLCAINPEVTDTIAQFLYPDRRQAQASVPLENSAETGSPAEDGTFSETAGGVYQPETAKTGYEEPEYGKTGEAGSSWTGEEGLSENISPEYVPPSQSDIHVPESVSGRNGYQQLKDEGEQIEDDAAELLKDQIGPGQTGDGLNFDVVYYPYYSMLDEKGKHLYRQIYANANALNQSFSPVEEIAASQLKNVFYAVFNDHPELFWLETAYFCKYTRSGRCVEIDLRFNRTAGNIEEAKAAFNENANAILDQARNLENNYAKERMVHDLLIDRVSYNMGAEMNQSAYSAMVNGQSVCAGYTRAYQYLLQQLGIPCYYCTGYAGENHAWNIVMLEDGFYNVDSTWDDTEGGNYEYFNKTDQDYADTHVRQELSVYLPPCNGQQYRNLEQAAGERLKSLEELGLTEENVLDSIADYYDDCYSQITAAGRGSYKFYSVIEEGILEEWNRVYQGNGYRQGYAEDAIAAVGASVCEMSLEVEELQGGRYLVTHTVNIE